MTDLTAKGEDAYAAAVRMADENGVPRPAREAFAGVSNDVTPPTTAQAIGRVLQPSDPLDQESAATRERMADAINPLLPRSAQIT